MNKMLIKFFLVMVLLYFGIIALRLSGEDLEDAVDILYNALQQLRDKDGPHLTLRGVLSASKLVPHVIYTFDAQLLGPKGQLDFCIVEISIMLIKSKTSLVAITCSGVEKHRQLLTEEIPAIDV